MSEAANDAKKKNVDTDDWLGYGVYADALWARIESALVKDSVSGTLGSDPLVIGVFGEWGAGKSKLLELIYRRAKVRNEADCTSRAFGKGDKALTLTVPVWFHPWKYEHEAHLGVPLLMHIREALGETLGATAAPGKGCVRRQPGAWLAMMGRRFLEIRTVNSGKTRFIRTVWGAMVRLMRLERLPFRVLDDREMSGHESQPDQCAVAKSRNQPHHRPVHRRIGRCRRAVG